MPMQGQEPVHDQVPSPTLGLGLHPGSTYTYNWHGHDTYPTNAGNEPYVSDAGHGSYTPEAGHGSYARDTIHSSYAPEGGGGYSQAPSPHYDSSGLGQYEGGHQMYYAPGMGGPSY